MQHMQVTRVVRYYSGWMVGPFRRGNAEDVVSQAPIGRGEEG